MKVRTFLLIIALVSVILSGCYPNIPYKVTEARLGQLTSNNKDLTSLPKPKEKIVCAVYKFRDQTGQYKNVENGSSWSTAVTQGATSILTKALEESGWFIPIEREGLSNLLNERKIIRSSRENFKSEEGTNLAEIPPLLYAGIILEGGIISYETNVYTGGAGLKYFGTGASGQYRQDQVSIYLRAISTQNGAVLKTVYTTKTILSQLMDVGLFKYVELKKILEAEAGYSYNEPPQMCVTAAIEKAVQSLVIEGIFDKFWELSNREDINSEPIKKYLHEKEEIKNPDNFYAGEQSSKYGISGHVGALQYTGDFGNSLTRPYADLSFNAKVSESLYLSLIGGGSKIAAEKYLEITAYHFGVTGNFLLTPAEDFSLLLQAGVLMNYRYWYTNHLNKRIPDAWFPSLLSGLGFRYAITPKISYSMILNNNYFVDDKLDNIKHGKMNDLYWGLKTGISFNF